MKSINELIGDLLLQNSCVIIPSLGGFVAKRSAASIDFSNGIMLPPTKSLLFNRQLVNNDGLLINEISRNRSISFDEAQQVLDQELANWKSALSNGGRIEIDRVGRIFFDAEKNFCFEQDRFYNLLLESYGLRKVHFLTQDDVAIVEKTIELMESHSAEKAIEKELAPVKPVEFIPTTQREKETIAPVKVIVPQVEKVRKLAKIIEAKNRDKTWRYIAAACLLPIAFYSFWIPLKTDVLESDVISFNDFNPFYKQQEGQYKEAQIEKIVVPVVSKGQLSDSLKNMPAETNVYTLKYDSAHYLQVNLNKDKTTVKETEDDIIISSNALNYIVGCFGNKSNAQRFVKQLKKEGFDARIADYDNGLHRVSAGAALSEEQLQSIAAKAKEKGHPGWVLR